MNFKNPEHSYALEMKNIKKTYPGVIANNDAFFSLRYKEIHALVGENGAGKTTLMKILSGLTKKDSGKIIVDNIEVDIKSSKDALDLGISIVPQNFELVPEFTVAENISLGKEPTKSTVRFIDERKRDETIKKLIDNTGLRVPITAIVQNLPVGVQQRVEILKMLYKGAQILILDEPTSCLTPNESDQLFVTLRKLKKMGKSVIFISHKLPEVFDIADRITVMKNGRTTSPFLTSETNPQRISNEMFPDKKIGHFLNKNLDKDTSTSASEVILRADKLVVKDQREIRSLNDISFKLRKGEILGVAGISGNGQNELAETLIGLRKVFSGEINFLSKNITEQDVYTRRKLGISYVPDDRTNTATVSDANITENLILNRQISIDSLKEHFVNWQKLDDFSLKLCNQFNVTIPGKNMRLSVSKLSGGNLQKLILAREFSARPKVMILFQPTQGLDLSTVEYIHNKIRSYAFSGISILLFSMDLDEIVKLSTRINVMYKGKLIGDFYSDSSSKRELGLYMSGVKTTDET